jgi:hypothetical protein
MREILVKFKIDWPEYEDIADEYLLIDLELDEHLKTGVSYELVKKENI